MNIQTIPLADLSLDPSNVRKHSRRNLDAIKASLRKFGQQKPIVVDAKGIVLAGNGTLTAAQELGWTEIQIVRTELAGVEATAFAIADNRTAELAEWEEDKLSQVLQSLKVEDADLLAATGYDAAEVDKMSKAEVTEDEVPEPPAKPITKPGDRIVLGRHTLVCGDSTDAGAWDALLAGRQAGMVWTDPPYGVSYVGKTKDALTIENDALDADGLQDFLRAALSLAWSNSREGAAWYVAAPPGLLLYEFATVLRELEVWRHTLTWAKDQFVMGRCDYHYRHEAIFYGWKEGAAHTWNGGRSQDSVLEIPRPRANKEHPTMKPVALIQRCIENSSNVDDLIVDPFSGSGSTMLAAEAAGRSAALIELSPAYCDVIVKRWEDFTGKKAVLDKPTT